MKAYQIAILTREYIDATPSRQKEIDKKVNKLIEN